MSGSVQKPQDKKSKAKILIGGIVFALICTVLFFIILVAVGSA